MSQPELQTKCPRLGFRTLIGLCAVLLAVALGHEIFLGFSGFALSCVFVVVVVFALTPLARVSARIPHSVSYILFPALYCLLELAFFLFGEAIDQPHPTYLHGNWVTVASSNFLPGLPLIAITILVLVAIDGVVQTSRPRDMTFFPRVSSLHAVIARSDIRFPLIIGAILVFGYYASTVIDVWHNQQIPVMVWPPKRVFVICNFLWGMLWIADCISRPKKGTIVGAIGFLVFTFFFLLPMGVCVLRE